MGEEIARTFVREGAQVLIADVAEEEGRKLAAALGSAARFIKLDIRSEEQWSSAIEEANATFGPLDVLVNNAGVVQGGSIEDVTLEQWRHVFAVNCDGTFLGCKQGVAAMKGRGGSIINISSAMGLRPYGTLASYCSSKSAVTMLTKSVALHCAEMRYGIRCNAIHPATVRTPLLERFLAAEADPVAAEKAYADLIPIGRIGEPQDVAAAVLFLASEESAFVTGCMMTVDGALTLG